MSYGQAPFYGRYNTAGNQDPRFKFNTPTDGEIILYSANTNRWINSSGLINVLSSGITSTVNIMSPTFIGNLTGSASGVDISLETTDTTNYIIFNNYAIAGTNRPIKFSSSLRFDAVTGILIATGLTADISTSSNYSQSALTGLASGISTFLGTPTSANLASAITDETGSGSLVFSTSPTFITPALGTPSSGNLTNCINYPQSSLSGLASGISTFLATPTSANFASAITNETGSGLIVFSTSPTLITPALGTPSSGVLSSCSAYPQSALTGLASGISTFLGTPSSANLASAITDETGSGSLVFSASPTITGVLTTAAITQNANYGITQSGTAVNNFNGTGLNNFGGRLFLNGTKDTSYGIEWNYGADNDRYGFCQSSSGVLRSFIANGNSAYKWSWDLAGLSGVFANRMELSTSGDLTMGISTGGQFRMVPSGGNLPYIEIKVNGTRYGYVGYSSGNNIQLGIDNQMFGANMITGWCCQGNLIVNNNITTSGSLYLPSSNYIQGDATYGFVFNGVGTGRTLAEGYYLQGGSGKNGGNLTATGGLNLGSSYPYGIITGSNIQSRGTTAGLMFEDRTTARLFQWYSSGDYVRLNNNSSDILQIDLNGGLYAYSYLNTPTCYSGQSYFEKCFGSKNDQASYIFNTTDFAYIGNSGAVAQFCGLASTSAAISTFMYATSTQEHITFFNPNGKVGKISTNGTTTTYATTSDRRLKKDIEPLTNSGDFIDSLKPSQFKWKWDSSLDQGFIADELSIVAPSCVSGEPDDKEYQMVDVSTPQMIANIIAELQSLRERIKILESVK